MTKSTTARPRKPDPTGVGGEDLLLPLPDGFRLPSPKPPPSFLLETWVGGRSNEPGSTQVETANEWEGDRQVWVTRIFDFTYCGFCPAEEADITCWPTEAEARAGHRRVVREVRKQFEPTRQARRRVKPPGETEADKLLWLACKRLHDAHGCPDDSGRCPGGKVTCMDCWAEELRRELKDGREGE